MLQKWTVKYQIATYSGEVSVYSDEDSESENVIAKCKGLLIRKYGPLPFGYQSFKIINRE